MYYLLKQLKRLIVTSEIDLYIFWLLIRWYNDCFISVDICKEFSTKSPHNHSKIVCSFSPWWLLFIFMILLKKWSNRYVHQFTDLFMITLHNRWSSTFVGFELLLSQGFNLMYTVRKGGWWANMICDWILIFDRVIWSFNCFR